ncbi:MAG TPA: hypothetical protein P5293_01275 [Bacteroidales bacterium]|nr:hypothetical protein [Bacteroidales bacterium]
MSSIREYLTESKGLAKYYTNVLDELISEFDSLIKSMETESTRYLEEKQIKEVKRALKTCERYVELLIGEINKITDFFAASERK